MTNTFRTRGSCELACEEGVDAWEMEMLRRARFGQDVTEYRPVAEDGNGDGVAKLEVVVNRVHSYDNRLSLQLLTQSAKTGAQSRLAQGPHVTAGAKALAEVKAYLMTRRWRRTAGSDNCVTRQELQKSHE